MTQQPTLFEGSEAEHHHHCHCCGVKVTGKGMEFPCLFEKWKRTDGTRINGTDCDACNGRLSLNWHSQQNVKPVGCG